MSSADHRGSTLALPPGLRRAHLGPHGREQPLFERLFREVGLPAAIQSDNRTPFCSTGLHGLSALNVWWIRLGIRPVRIEPSHPEQNGAHERMHRTFKAETTRPPAVNRRGQQRKFEAFRYTY